jgi:hypothetical protein
MGITVGVQGKGGPSIQPTPCRRNRARPERVTTRPIRAWRLACPAVPAPKTTPSVPDGSEPMIASAFSPACQWGEARLYGSRERVSADPGSGLAGSAGVEAGQLDAFALPPDHPGTVTRTWLGCRSSWSRSCKPVRIVPRPARPTVHRGQWHRDERCDINATRATRPRPARGQIIVWWLCHVTRGPASPSASFWP